jgi:hypothetical protein
MILDSNTISRQAILVRDWLANRYLSIHGVKLIDIGYTSNPKAPGRQVVVRIHVEDEDTRKSIHFPESMRGIPIQVLVGDIKLE